MTISQNKAESGVVPITDWQLPPNIRAAFTVRQGGVSKAPYASFNLATHVGDQLNDVKHNRADLLKRLNLPAAPFWLQQEHTDIAIDLGQFSSSSKPSSTVPPIADASWTQQAGQVAVVMTADCLPILLAAKDGSVVAAIHAGWKGLANQIVTKTIKALPTQPQNLTAWIGPSISQAHFEVGQDVWQAFVDLDATFAEYFVANKEQKDKYYADLASIAATQMQQLGIDSVIKSGLCSYGQEQDFFSYRRDGQTGRMASLIWIESDK